MTMQVRTGIAGGVRPIVVLIVAAITFWLCFPRVSAAQEASVLRAPFVLRLRIDSDRYYEEKFDRVPYVAVNEVYIFAGEFFGITATITENEISRITYQRDPRKADVEFKFTQEISPTGSMMLLMTRNKLKQKLFFDALMTVPQEKEIYKTTVLPVKPALSTVESWPHPIVQLVLRNFRFSEKPKEQTETVDPKTGNLHLQIPVVASTKQNLRF